MHPHGGSVATRSTTSAGLARLGSRHDPDRTQRAPEFWWTGDPLLPGEPAVEPEPENRRGGGQWLEEPITDPDPTENTPRFTRKHVLVVAALVLLAALIAAYSMLRARTDEPVPVAEPVPAATPVEPAAGPAATSTPAATLRIHVVGAVRTPGVHELETGARVIDAVDRAGGLTPDAAPGELNFAQPLADGQQVWIGNRGEPGGEVRAPGVGDAPAADPGDGGGAPSGEGGPVNLNTAGAAELQELPGVGPTTAQKIITWREENGGFRSVEDLLEIRGIGEKTFAELAPLVTV